MNFNTKSACCFLAGVALVACCFMEQGHVRGQVGPDSNNTPKPKEINSEDFGYSNSKTPSMNAVRPAGQDQFYQIRDRVFYSNWPIPTSHTVEGGRNRRGAKQNPAAVQMQQAIQKYTAAKTDDEKQAARQEMSVALLSYFDNDMKSREADIAQIEERIKKLRAQLAERREAKDQIVDLQVQLLINEANGLGFYGNQDSTKSRYVIGTSEEFGPGLYVVPPRKGPQVEGPDSGLELEDRVQR